MKLSVKGYILTALCSLSLWAFPACENQIASEELTSGDSVLTLHANYGTDIACAQFFNANERFKVKNNPFVRSGYSFLGWTDTEKSSIVLYNNRSEVVFSSSRDLYAVWELKNYAITYKVNGGRRNVENPGYFTVKDDVTLDSVRNGKFLFGGWYDNESFDGEPLSSVKAGTVGDKTFYARWCGKILYNLHGGTLSDGNTFLPYELAAKTETEKVESVTEKVSEEQTALTESDEEVDAAEVGMTASEEDSVEGSLAEGDVAETEKVAESEEETEGESKAEDESAEKEGSDDFLADAVDDAESSDSESALSSEIKSETGDQQNAVAVRYFTLSDTITLPVPEKENEVFGGWYYDEACTLPAGEAIKNAKSAEISLYAKWNEPQSYAITYELNGGENPEDCADTYINSSKATPLAVPSRYGYTFTGWYSDKDCATEALSAIAPFTLGDVTFYAGWKKADFIVTYQNGNAAKGTVPKAQVVTYESDVTVLSNTGKLFLEGCTFIGWHALLADDAHVNLSSDLLSAAEGYVAAGDSYTVLGNVTLTPVWQLKKYIHPLDEAEVAKKGKKKIIPPKDSELTSVLLPAQVRDLGESVFSRFTSLSRFDFTNLVSVGEKAFAHCHGLTTIDLKEVESLASSAFEDCKNLMTVVLPDELKEIGTDVFEGCPDGMVFIADASRLDYYTNLLTPEAVGKAQDTYTVLTLTSEESN